MAALLGALGRRGSGPAVLERLLHAPGAAIGACLVHVGSHQRSAEQAAEADGMDVTQMDSGTLQSLAGLMYLRAETFESYLSRSEADVAQQLQLLIGKLDRPRRAMLMQKLAAVSERRATPVILAWAVSCTKRCLAELLQASGSSGDAALQAVRLELLSLAQSAAKAAGKAEQEFPSDAAALQWLLDPQTPLSWQHLLALPGMEHVLHAATATDPQLQLACTVLGIEGLHQGQLHAQVTQALAGLHASSCQLAAQALGLKPESDTGSQHALMSKAAAAAEGKGAAAGSDLAQAAAGVALARWTSAQLGASLAPDLQVVTRLLRTSPFHLTSGPAGAGTDTGGAAATGTGGRGEGEGAGGLADAAKAVACITPELLQGVAQQLAQQQAFGAASLLSSAAAAVAAPWQHQGAYDASLTAALTAAAAAQPGSPAAALLSATHAWRKAMLVAGVPCIMSSATAHDLALLSGSEAQALQAGVARLDAAGSALEPLVLPASNGRSSSTTGAAPVVDLDKLQSLSLDMRLALAWRLRTPAASQRAAQRLVQALHSSAVRRHRAHSRESDAFDALVTAFALERQVAELDIVSDRLLLPEGAGAEALLAERYDAQQGQQRLPSEGQLQAASSKGGSDSKAPDGDLGLFDALLEGDAASEAQVLSAFEVLIQGIEGQEDLRKEQVVPDTYKEWFYNAKLAVNKLSPAMLALLRRFLTLKIRVTKADAEEAQQRTRLLLQAVQAELRRADRSSGTASSSGRGVAASPYWSSVDGGRQQEAPPAPALPTAYGTISEVDPGIVKALLKEGEAAEFSQWLRTVALQVATGPYDMLAQEHSRMDMERYLLLRHHPDLGPSFESAPLPWKEAGPRGIGSEDEFLEAMRSGLNSYVSARGMEPLSSVEWEVYKQHALAEFSVMREANEEELREAGHSTFFNSKAEADYLRAMLEAGVNASSPIHEQAHRYLTVLETNSSWTFAQKKQVVQRLVDLSQHFSKQGAVSERGSPFAPLFSATAKPLVPKLPSKAKGEEDRAAARAQIPAGY